MEQKVNDLRFLRKKDARGCFAMFMLMVLITASPLFFPSRDKLAQQGLLFVAMLLMEFFILVPLYFLFFKHRKGLGKGKLDSKMFVILLMLVLFFQIITPLLFNASSETFWAAESFLQQPDFWLFLVTIVFIAPVYEEIVFRGCLYNSLLYWFNGRVAVSALIVSLLFSLLHTQYMQFSAFLILFIVSLIFVYARVKSGGLLTPILLHMTMNAVVIGVKYIYVFVT